MSYINGKKCISLIRTCVETEEKTATPTQEVQEITPSEGKYLSKVTINAIPNTYVKPSGHLELTTTGTYVVKNYMYASIKEDNLIAENIKKDVSILGITGTYEGSGGDTTQEDGLITGEITSYTNDRITKVREHAFSDCSKLTSVNLPNVTSISTYSFGSCSKLINVNLPNLTSIGYNAFNGCSNLTNVNMPNVTSIGYQAFYQCSNLTSVSFPNATSIGTSTFQSCISLTSVNLPQVTSITERVFYQCSNLTSVSFPNATSIGTSTFQSCISLTSVNLPQVTSIGSSAFSSCSSLIKLIITQTNSVCTLASTTAFNYCYHFLGTTDSTYNPEGLKDGRIYVPDELVDSYKEATNWSAYADIIVGLSELPTEE